MTLRDLHIRQLKQGPRRTCFGGRLILYSCEVSLARGVLYDLQTLWIADGVCLQLWRSCVYYIMC